MLVAIDTAAVEACPACVICADHAHGPVSALRGDRCPNGCALCGEHVVIGDPHGSYVGPSAEDMVTAWESYMTVPSDVAGALRTAAARRRA
jgi:hypothetical protein